MHELQTSEIVIEKKSRADAYQEDSEQSEADESEKK